MRSTERASYTSVTGPGVIAGRYRIEHALGVGGAGQVYRVTDLASGEARALKRLTPTASRKLAALFELEYRTLARLQHPSVVRVFEFGRDEGGAFYTMELLEGDELAELAPLSWRQVGSYLRDAAQALDLLHAHGLVHRDVSARNLWRMPDGRAKLIDFGAVAPFGHSDHLMGTAPFVAPEAFHGQTLDARTDLYSLGAVAYFLLTRTHAFPARELRELPELWQQRPAPPSQRAAELARDDLPPIPAELDSLVLALLSPSALARPSSGAEVIDRLNALLGATGALAPPRAELAAAHLSSTAYVGQERARARLRRMLQLAVRGRGQSVVITGEPGVGRSRLMRELALEAQVASATVLHVQASGGERAFGVASALSSQLLAALPSAARLSAQPHRRLLSSLVPALRDRTLQRDSDPVAAVGELRPRLQLALSDWLAAVAQRDLLVVLVDDLQRADEGSLAFLLALAQMRRHARLLLVTTLPGAPERASAPVRALANVSHRVSLGPLDAGELRALLRSVFGEAEYLDRLVNWLAPTTRGNPGHTLELCAQLVARDVIGYAEGTWLLPQEPPGLRLSSSREQALLARVELLAPPARALGRVLAVHTEALPLELAAALVDRTPTLSLGDLQGLIDAGVCMREGDLVRFTHGLVRARLAGELDLATRREADRVVGEFLLARAGGALDRLRAGLHLLEGADPRGAALVAEAALHVVVHQVDDIKPAAPFAERALALLRDAQRPDRELVPLLALLAIAGYSADRVYAARHAEAALAVLQEVYGLNQARALRPYLGRKGSLIAALSMAGLRLAKHRQDPRVVGMKEGLPLLFNVVAALVGVSVVCLDPVAARRTAEVLAPFAALGEEHLAGFIHDYCMTLADAARDQHASVRLRFETVLSRLQTTSTVRGLSESMRLRFLHGALSTLGAIETQRDGDDALRRADQLGELGLSLSALAAAQIRAVYAAYQGDLGGFARHRADAEHQAIQLGTSWQVETWGPPAQIFVAFRTRDAMSLKRVAEQLARLSQQIPSLDRLARRARGAYLALRGRKNEALPWLEEVLREPPRAYAGWTRAIAMLAQVFNELGDPQRALEVCDYALAHMTSEDLAFGGSLVAVQRERLVAQAGCGQPELARLALGALIAHHAAGGGPLMLGELHETGFTLARLRGDQDEARAHFDKLERLYLSTGVASLAQHCARLRQPLEVRAAHAGGQPSVTSMHTAGSTLWVDRLLAGGSLSFAERVQKALQILAESMRGRQATLYLNDEVGLRPVGALQDALPPPEVTAWLARRLAREYEEDEAATSLVALEDLTVESDWLEDRGMFYRACVLFADRVPFAIAAIAAEELPSGCVPEVLGAVAYHLKRTLTRADVSDV